MLTVTNSIPGVPESEFLLEPCIWPHGTTQQESDDEYSALARIPQHFAWCRVGNFEPANAAPRYNLVNYCKTWPPAESVLLMAGPPGTGKTHLAAGALHMLRATHGDKARGRFWPVIDLLERYRRTFDDNRATETIEDVEQSLARVPVLVLDDFGAHKSTEWAEERLFKLIDSRYGSGKALIVTTNLTLQELPPRIKSRLASGSVINFNKQQDRRLA